MSVLKYGEYLSIYTKNWLLMYCEGDMKRGLLAF